MLDSIVGVKWLQPVLTFAPIVIDGFGEFGEFIER